MTMATLIEILIIVVVIYFAVRFFMKRGYGTGRRREKAAIGVPVGRMTYPRREPLRILTRGCTANDFGESLQRLRL
jgi:hypothetical protein